ncbi:MAG: hypothetical protein AB7F86_06070 [Bdellovibrionales bacterium]
MKQIKSVLWMFFAILIVAGIGTFVVTNYSYVFSKRVKGKILDVQRVTNPSAVFTSKVTDAQIHSYSILIQGDDGKLYTSSSDDRQWQVAGKGYCVEVLLYRYPPWNLEKGNTYYNARLEELSLCNGQPVPMGSEAPKGEAPSAGSAAPSVPKEDAPPPLPTEVEE